jgi:hypothetical protein
LKYRAAASVVVVGGWCVILVGVVIAHSFVTFGPERFLRYVGAQRFLVPWQFSPLGMEKPTDVGFSVSMCLEGLQGTYDTNCQHPGQLNVASSANNFALIFDERYWRSHLSEMTTGEERYGHNTYLYPVSSGASGAASVTQYLARYDRQGKLVRLVVCRPAEGKCEHHALVRNYMVSYYVDKSSLPNWESWDRKVADLVDSWRAQ